MTTPECLKLRRKARRSQKIRTSAAMLLAEICDYHALEKGCIAKNSTFADRLGCTERAVRDWLRELKVNGFVAVAEKDGCRLLIPRIPDWMEWNDDSGAEQGFQDGTSDPENTPLERKERSSEGGKSVPPQRDNNPEGTRERAREEGEAPVTMEKAVETGQMVGVSKQLCREWWLHYDSKGWPFEVKSVSSALQKWKLNDKKFNGGSGGTPGGDGASRQLPDDQDVIHFGSTR